MKMKPLRRRNGNQYLHRESLDYRNAVKRKINAYHLFIQTGLLSQGLVQYLAVAFPKLMGYILIDMKWDVEYTDSFGEWWAGLSLDLRCHATLNVVRAESDDAK